MKKLISLLLALTMLISLSISVFATEGEQAKSQEEIMAINEVNVAKYAMSFIDTIYDGSNLETGKVFAFYSENDKVSGYCVDIMNDNTPSGYVIVKFSENEPVISEFSIETCVKNPYETIMEQANVSDNDAVFYSVGSNDYQVFSQRKKLIFENHNKVISENEFAVYKEQAQLTKQDMLKQNSDNNRVINYSDLDGWSVVSDDYEGTVNEEKTITGAGSISYYGTSSVNNIDKTYACAVVALCNLMKYYRSRGYSKISSSFSTLYSALWDLAGTDSNGSTPNGNEAGAAKNYLENLGYNCSTKSYWFDRFSDFKKDLSDNKPCLFTYGAKFGDKPGGHAVFVVGYVDTSSYEYLQIADGWNSYLRYINFNGYDYSRTDGWAFTVSK